jgi:hypothetical protein
MASNDLDDGPRRHTPGTHSLRLRNLPAAIARGAPATETTVMQLIWQHTGIATFNVRTCYRWLTRRHDFAYAFVEVPAIHDGEALIHSIANIITDRVPWEAEWCHDSFASLMADSYTLTNPDYPDLAFHQHHIRGTQRVVDNSTGMDIPWEIVARDCPTTRPPFTCPHPRRPHGQRLDPQATPTAAAIPGKPGQQ